MTFWKSSAKDKVKNGTILGAILGACIVWGDKIYSSIDSIIPSTWNFLGSFTVPAIIILVSVIVGYCIDKY